MLSKIARVLFYAAILTAFLILISGYGSQWGFWGFRTGFVILRYSAYAAIALAVMSLISLFFIQKMDRRSSFFASTGFILSLTMTLVILFWVNRLQSAPPIHDITTNLDSPPEFVDIVRLRADAPNPPEYSGEETAVIQREFYPEIQPLVLSKPPEEVIDLIVNLIDSRGWNIVSINRQAGRIEATEKLAWYGFKDDVVILVTETRIGSRIDMRSKSRIGRGDIGVNARRVHKFIGDLHEKSL